MRADEDVKCLNKILRCEHILHGLVASLPAEETKACFSSLGLTACTVLNAPLKKQTTNKNLTCLINIFHTMINSPQASLLDHPKVSQKMFLNHFPAVGHGGL